MPKVSEIFLKFLTPLLNHESELELDSPEARSILQLGHAVWNAVVMADNNSQSHFLEQIRLQLKGEESQSLEVFNALVEHKRKLFGSFTWLIGNYEVRKKKGEVSLYVESYSSRGYCAQKELQKELPSQDVIAKKFTEFAGPSLVFFGSPPPRTDAFDAAFAIAHVVWNAVVMDKLDKSKDHLREAKARLGNNMELQRLIDSLAAHKRNSFGELNFFLGVYDYTPQDDGSFFLWVEPQAAAAGIN